MSDLSAVGRILNGGLIMKKPNVLIVFADQWRAQAMGYAGNSDVRTPNIDDFSRNSVDFTNAVSGTPVCSPYRASLMKGQYPTTHGVFLNDVCLNSTTSSIADAFAADGYDTAYIGKWHLDGHGRSAFIPHERRQGFDYWKVLECTHDYNNSPYYAGDSDEKRYWNGYDAFAQTNDALEYLKHHGNDNPFFMCLSWGPPHAPYDTAPEAFKRMYDPETTTLRENVPLEQAERARRDIAGYYAHCTALDQAFGRIVRFLKEKSLYDDTIVLFTSDHGDMLGSQGEVKKQRPWDESIRVPFLLKPAGVFSPRSLEAPIDAPDVMPTLLGLAGGVATPESVEGIDFGDYALGGNDPSDGAALLSCPHPFGQWTKTRCGGREYRGIRTTRYTYVRDLRGPWLLYDNALDPFQKRNLADDDDLRGIRAELELILQAKLDKIGDEFLPGNKYVRKWGYEVNEDGTVEYTM
ncbi:MAG: sulfatase [Kiritimatiellaeota bacterium]|nr:sulfatase [Kiritimatiellota bacterium]